MHSLLQFLTALVLVIPFLCACNGKLESDPPQQDKTKTVAKSGKHPGPEAWEVDPATEAKITFYVKGMSKRLKLT